ncbi:MAG: type II/IV secretion system protein [Candidatus Omnitrophica bacterium]|nr:type II/IV secretion system protein [Candidatus Omnitrophota bacterium]
MTRPSNVEKNLRIGEILIKHGVINEAQLYEGLEEQKTKKKMLGAILIDKGFLTEETLLRALAQEYLLTFVDLNAEPLDESLFKNMPLDFLRKHHLFPLRVEEWRLVVAISDPLDIMSPQELGRLTGYSTKVVIATRKQIDTLLNKYFTANDHTAAAMNEIAAKKKEHDVQAAGEKSLKDLEIAVQDGPLVKLVNSILTEAIGQGASDVHFEPQAEGMFIRFRVDGVLYEKMMVPKDLQPAAISRLKIVSGMDIAERRMPQDGRMSITQEGKIYDIRASTLPGIFGEKMVLRILDKESVLLPLDHVGFDEHELEVVRHLILRPYGIILITGPTGSGKTTTLYSMLNTLNEQTRNIVTVEDPVEYELPRVNQTAINVRAGYTFATAIRHILRQDPDIIMVGEIRDLETAEIAVQAAITGHLVLSTLHTNNATGAITRLLDMGVEPFLISSSVVGVIAQRLVRKLCPHCQADYEENVDSLRSFDKAVPAGSQKITLAKPQGCEKCNQRGYSKRTGIFEILVMSDEIRKLTLQRADESELTKQAIAQGMRTLNASGVAKAIAKVTSLEEVMRVAFLDAG